MHKLDRQKLIDKGNTYRIFIFLAVVFVVLAFAYTPFFESANIKALVTTALLYICAGAGFTLVMIGGNFDLSITAIINAGAVVSMGEFGRFYAIFGGSEGGTGALVGAWVVAFILALAVGSGIGALNGFLVAKVKVHSFIVTIGMLTAISGFVYTYSNGNTISSPDYALAETLNNSIVKAPYIEILTPQFIIVGCVIAVCEIFLVKTRWGYDLFMVGSNKDAAFYSGINTQKKVWVTFIISGFTASLGGALFAISMNAAVPNFGERGIAPLMMVLAATIIGGTVMTGGAGSVLKTAIAVITIQAIFNGLISMGMGFDAQVLAAGVLLGAIVFYESFSLHRQDLRKGERPALVREAMEMRQ
jgi:ribose transport system permease protein